MNYVLLLATAAAFAFVGYLALIGDAASPRIMAGYIVASLVALVASMVVKPWATKIKWVWVALSLLVVYAIFTGPLDSLRLN